MARVAREWDLTPDQLALLADISASVVPDGDYDCPASAWVLSGECLKLRDAAAEACGADDASESAHDTVLAWDHIIRVRLARGLQEDIRREHASRSRPALVDIVVPSGVSYAKDGTVLDSERVAFDPWRAIPTIDAEGRRTGYYQISYIFSVSRSEFDAAVARVIAAADGGLRNMAVALRFRAQWDKHPDASTLADACAADGIDPMDFGADADVVFGT